jgi:hypothetical protein
MTAGESMKSRLDRRTFLKDAGALTVSAAALVAGAPMDTSSPAPDHARIGAALFDGRYSSCRAFADALARKGAVAFDVRADIAALWYGQLRDHLAKYGGSIAGLTTDSDFVVSESFGRQFRLSLRYAGSHDSRGCAALTHKLRSLQGVAGIESALRHADSNWGEAIGHALAHARSAEPARQWESAAVHTSQLDDHPGFLRSWLLDA